MVNIYYWKSIDERPIWEFLTHHMPGLSYRIPFSLTSVLLSLIKQGIIWLWPPLLSVNFIPSVCYLFCTYAGCQYWTFYQTLWIQIWLNRIFLSCFSWTYIKYYDFIISIDKYITTCIIIYVLYCNNVITLFSWLRINKYSYMLWLISQYACSIWHL